MQVSVETLEGLERKLTVSLPKEDVDQAVNTQIRKFATQAKMDGFRPGKIPLQIVKARFLDGIHEEVTRELIEGSLFEALKKADLVPVATPGVEPKKLKEGEVFSYDITLEVFPEIKLTELNPEQEIDQFQAEVEEDDVEDALEKLRKNRKEWALASRPVALHDKIRIDLEIFLGDQKVEAASKENIEAIVDEQNWLKPLVDKAIGLEKGMEAEVELTFPENIEPAEIAGKEGRAKFVIHEVFEGVLPPLDEHFAKNFNINKGGIDELKKELKKSMISDLERKLNLINKEAVFNAFSDLNRFDLPKVLVEQEIDRLNHEMYHQIFGTEHRDDEKVPRFKRELFEAKAKRRVHMGLLLSHYIEAQQITVDEQAIQDRIKKLAEEYEKPEEASSWYQNKENRKAIEQLLLEEKVSEKILEKIKVNDKKISYDEVGILFTQSQAKQGD